MWTKHGNIEYRIIGLSFEVRVKGPADYPIFIPPNDIKINNGMFLLMADDNGDLFASYSIDPTSVSTVFRWVSRVSA